MAKFDRHLVAPRFNGLVEALLSAARAANDNWPTILSVNGAFWESVVRGLPGRLEGLQRWRESRWSHTAEVQLAWWTDRQGKRHFRVIGDVLSSRTEAPADPDPRPPFWHVYPDRTFYRSLPAPDGQIEEWPVVCGCGEIGWPLELGWVGDCCAACHDRREEGAPVAMTVPVPSFHRPLSTRRDDDHPFRLAFSPDGHWLATPVALDSGFEVIVLSNLPTGETRTLPGTRNTCLALAFSADGKLLASTDGAIRFLIHDLTTGQVVFDHQEDFPIGALAFAPHGLALAVGGREGAQVWERRDRQGPWELRHVRTGAVASLAFSPQGDLLAVGGSSAVTLLDAVSGELLETVHEVPPPHAVCDLVYLPRRPGVDRLVALLSSHSWYSLAREREVPVGGPPAPRVCVWDLISRRCQPVVTWEVASLYRGALSADGRHLAWVQALDDELPIYAPTGPHAHFLDLTTGQRLGQVGWNVTEALIDLALSPVGRDLAVVDHAGVAKLIPWGLLLGA